MEIIKMPLEHTVIKKTALIIILSILWSNTILSQTQNNIPELIDGESIRNTIKLRCVNRRICLGIGIYKFRVSNYGSVDSLICKGNLGKYADSLQKIELKKLVFKPLKQNSLVWFQIKVYSTRVTHESSKYLVGLEDTMEHLFEQEINDYFPYSDHPNIAYIVREDTILLPPLRLRVVQ